MLKTLTLTNFRKHEHLHLEFQPGTVVVRGHNEAGKSSVFQAIAYALFGARALPQPIDEVVSYGKAANTLRVRLMFELDGVEYEVERSTRGAEVRHSGGLVTGQTETSEFVQKLVGAPAQLATSLWFANQGSIRGALASGSKATTSLIETLADFSQIDKLVEAIQSNLTTGQTKPFEERLAQAEATLAEIGEPVPPPDPAAELEAMRETAAQLEAAATIALREHAAFEKQTLVPARDRAAKLTAAETAMQDAHARFERVTGRRSAFVQPAYDAGKHREARADHEAAKVRAAAAGRRKIAKAAFDKLPEVQSCWDGDGPSFLKFCEQAETDLTTVRAQISAAQIELAGLNKAALEGMCQVCGLDYDAVPAVGEKNAEVRRQKQKLIEQIATFEDTRKLAEQARTATKTINQQWAAYRDFVAKYDEYVDVETDRVPPVVLWKDKSTEADDDLAKLKAELDRQDAAEKAHIRATAEWAELERQCKEAADDVATAQNKLAGFAGADEAYEKASLEGERLRLAAQSASLALGAYRTQLEAARLAHERAHELYVERNRTWTLAKEAAEQARTQLAEVSFNNVLLKKVRAARPVIVDRLWSVLLAAVSLYFSQMRGTSSTVTRKDGSFLVDSKSIEGLSGSTLDILGLAIRVALLKTFLPSCSFLVLDEPAAACDDEREASLIGTITAAQFDQVVLVTHSDLADAYANQLVTL